MKRKIFYMIGIMVLAIPLFWICNMLNPAPGKESGNGNPAILLLPIIIIMFCYLVYLWIKILNRYNIKPLVFLVGITATFMHLVFSTLYQRSSFLEYKTLLAETYKKDFGFIDWEYIDIITSFMSLHVNKQYFNANTYFMFLTSPIFLALILLYYRMKNVKNQ